MVVLVEDGQALPAEAFNHGLVGLGDEEGAGVQVDRAELPLRCVVPLSFLGWYVYCWGNARKLQHCAVLHEICLRIQMSRRKGYFVQ